MNLEGKLEGTKGSDFTNFNLGTILWPATQIGIKLNLRTQAQTFVSPLVSLHCVPGICLIYP